TLLGRLPRYLHRGGIFGRGRSRRLIGGICQRLGGVRRTLFRGGPCGRFCLGGLGRRLIGSRLPRRCFGRCRCVIAGRLGALRADHLRLVGGHGVGRLRCISRCCLLFARIGVRRVGGLGRRRALVSRFRLVLSLCRRNLGFRLVSLSGGRFFCRRFVGRCFLSQCLLGC